MIHFIILFVMISTIAYEQLLIRNQTKALSILSEDEPRFDTDSNVETQKDSLFTFNPNDISKEGLITLGLKNYLAERLINFRLKGGVFKVPEDLLVIYDMDSAWVNRVKEHVRLPQLQQETTKSKNKTTKDLVKNSVASQEKNLRVDINKADTTDLKKVRGIGSVLSARIIKFRDKLGGFYNMSQLAEVYGLSAEIVSKLEQGFFIDENFEPIKISISNCTLDDLKSHPYISYKTAELLINYRNNHQIISKEDLKKVPLSDETLVKLLPYISFQ